MTREKALERVKELASEYATVDYIGEEKYKELFETAYQFDIVITEDDEYIAVEDEIFYYTEEQ